MHKTFENNSRSSRNENILVLILVLPLSMAGNQTNSMSNILLLCNSAKPKKLILKYFVTLCIFVPQMKNFQMKPKPN